MTYQALARKWRPRNFDQLVGQAHVRRALVNALETGRIHPAYLFTGTRGVGKTTLARLLAKCLNCEQGVSAQPCGECESCREIEEGRFIDLIEVDAASRTKVEDTRELLENVQYAPVRGRYKVYLIDEVHMLSGHSFNALLKTLEEPPPHIKFLLATTDPQKIPVTVLSRCLQFNLKRLSQDQIRTQMEEILRRENLDFEASAVKSLARAADGSMRDGLSLLDQAIVHGSGRLLEADVSGMLGTVARRPVFELMDALAESNAAALLAHIEGLAEHAPDFGDILQQLLILLHHSALGQWVPEAVRRDEDGERILEFSRRLPAEDLQLFYQIGLTGQRDLPLAPDPRSGFEMVLLRMLAFRPVNGSGGTASVQAPPARETRAVKKVASPPVATENSGTAPPPPEPTLVAPAAEAAVPPKRLEVPTEETSATLPGNHTDWLSLIRAMGLTAMTRELANNCVLERLEDERCSLLLDPGLAHLRNPRVEANLEKALQDHFRRPLKLGIRMETPGFETPATRMQREQEERQRAAEIEIEQDENVRALKEQFGARIVPGSIKPLD